MRVEGLTNHWGKYLRWWKMFVMMKINIKQIIFLELLLLLFNVWDKLSVPWLYTLIILSMSFQQNENNLFFCISPFKVKWQCAFTSHKWNIIRFIFIFIIRNRIRFKWKKMEERYRSHFYKISTLSRPIFGHVELGLFTVLSVRVGLRFQTQCCHW